MERRHLVPFIRMEQNASMNWRKLIPSITQRMLTLQLRELESDEVVSRKVYPVVPPQRLNIH